MLLKPISFMRAQTGGGGGITDPNDASIGAVIWLDGTDFTYLKQDVAGSTAVTATGQTVAYFVDRTAQTNDFEAISSAVATSATSAVTFANSRFRADATITGLVSGEMELYALLSTSDGAWMMMGKNGDSAVGLGVVENAATSPTAGISGTVVYSTNGVDISSPTRNDLLTEWSTGTYVVAGARGMTGLDTTMSGSSMLMLAYNISGFWLNGDVKHWVLTPSLTTQERSDLIDWLKAEGGIA